MNTKHMMTWVRAGLLCTMCGGCEILGPLLIAESTNSAEPTDFTSAPLSVDIESITGTMGGEVLEREMFTPTGERFGNQLTFRLTSQSGLEITVITETESSNTNPYELPLDSLPNEDGTGISDMFACHAVTCEEAEDFGIEIIQTEHGRNAIVDGFWPGEQHIGLSLRYTENH